MSMRGIWISLLLSLGLQGSEVKLAIMPSRAVLTDDQRSAAFTLINQGSQAATFELSFIHLEMDDQGNFREVPSPKDPITDLLTAGPDSTRLEPGESQIFRVLLKRPLYLATGEYRVHLVFRNVDESVAASGESAMGGISVPLIIRHRTSSAHVTLKGLTLKQGSTTSALVMNLCRTGQQSVYGDFHVSFLSDSGRENPVASLKGIAVYASQDHRRVEIPLPEGVLESGGRYRVSFDARDQEAEAQAELVVTGK